MLTRLHTDQPDDKKHLVARNHRYSSNDHEHRTPDEHDHRGDQGHHSLSSSVHTGGGIKVENHHSESNGSSHHRGDKGDYRHHGDGQYGLERFRGDDSHHGSNHKSGFDPEPGRDERYLSDEFPQRSQTSSRHGDNHNDSEAQHRKDVYDNYRYFDDALLGERDGSRSPDRSSDEAHEHRGQKHGKHGVLEDLRGFYRPEDRGKAHGGEHDHHRTDSRGYLDNDFFDRSGRGTKHHDNEYRPGQTFGNNFRHTEDEERGSKRYDPSYSLDDGQQSQGRGLSSFGQELDDWYGQGNRGISNGSPRSSRDHGPFEDGYFGHGRQSNPKSGRDRDNEGGVYFGKGLRGTYQPIEQELQESRRPSESYRYRDSRPSSDTSSGFSNELEDWYGPDGNRAEPPNKGRGRDQYDYIPFERENKSDRSQQAQGGAERSDTGLDHDLRKGGKAVSGGLTREAGLTRNKADGGKTSSESSPRKKEKGSQGGLRKEGEFYQQDIKKDRAHVNEDLQKEDDFVDQSLKKDGKHIDKAPHNGSQEMDDGLHQNGSKADKGLHSEAKKVDKNAHSDTNDVDDDMHEDGKKIDYQLHDYGNGLAGLEHDATSGSKSGKNEQKEEKERTKSDDKILKELFSDTEKEGKKSGPSKQDSRKDGQENVFKPKTVHIGIAGESLNHI